MAVMALEMRVTPREVWEMDPRDMATVAALLEDRAKRRR